MTTSVAQAPKVFDPPPRRRIFKDAGPLTYFFIFMAAALTIVPVVYVILGGFRTTGQLAANPVSLPNPWVFDNYVTILQSGSFWTQVKNSTLIALGTTIGVVWLGVMAAYPLARYAFKGRETIYTIFTLGLLFPIGVAILPLYLLLRDLNLLGTPYGVILPQIAFALPLTVVILRPFLKAIPVELEEAAAIDGASRVGFFFRILLPLAMPAMVTVGVLAFVGSWNAYLLPMLTLSSPADYTLPLGVQAYSTRYSSDTAAILAFTSLAMLPALAFFTLMERRIVGGLTGAVKG